MIWKKHVIAVNESNIVAGRSVNSAISSCRYARIRLPDYFYSAIRPLVIVKYCGRTIRGSIVNSNYF